MKLKSPFTIVNRPHDLTLPQDIAEASVASALRKRSKKIASSLDAIPPALKAALLSAAVQVRKQETDVRSTKNRVKVSLSLNGSIIQALEKGVTQTTASTVGILDLGAWVTRLPHLLNTMNKAQDRLVFLEIHTPVPAGLIKTQEPLIQWAEEMIGHQLGVDERSQLNRNMLADEFYYFAESVRQQHRLDVLIGLTPAMIAFTDINGPAWNYYAAGQEAVSVVSTCDLREFSAQARRPYEAAIGMLVAAQVLALRNNLDYHPETRGCIFDFNEIRSDIVKSIRGMKIDPQCMCQFKDSEEGKAAQALIAALARMKETNRG